MDLPSVQSIVVDGLIDSPRIPGFPPRRAELTELKISRSDLSIDGAKDLLQYIDNLKYFEYAPISLEELEAV